ncbi:MAG TPA: efflux RND transporter periplasmic adaptor subunit [Pirellulaceae bacterium]|nr:efflux RND transporter periplasmic adaptor subunit [Pirellulaceae bacterium]
MLWVNRSLVTGKIPAFLLILCLLVGCQPPNAYQPPPAPEVAIAKLGTQDVEDYLEFTGTTRATDVVEVRARVGGYLRSIHFEDGADIKKGDLLFVIEREPFEVALALAKANLQKAKASLELAKSNLKRYEPLAQRNALTEQELDVARADVATADADVASGDAQVSKAELDLSYTEIRAPISGRIGRHMVDVGNLVVPQTNLLTTIESYQPIFAYFTVSEQDVLRLIERRRVSTSAGTTAQPRELQLGLTDQGDYPFAGELDFAEVGIDASTGTQMRRGVFANEDHRLVPGLFVRIRLPLGEPEPRTLIDERAIAADQRGEYALVVNDKNVVEYRPVALGMRVKGMRVVEDGIKPGEWVVVNGLQRARPGAPVKPVDAAGQAIDLAAAADAPRVETAAAAPPEVVPAR